MTEPLFPSETDCGWNVKTDNGEVHKIVEMRYTNDGQVYYELSNGLTYDMYGNENYHPSPMPKIVSVWHDQTPSHWQR